MMALFEKLPLTVDVLSLARSIKKITGLVQDKRKEEQTDNLIITFLSDKSKDWYRAKRVSGVSATVFTRDGKEVIKALHDRWTAKNLVNEMKVLGFRKRIDYKVG